VPTAIPRAVVEVILLGAADDRRQLQDSPILGDLWIAFAQEADRSLDLLITPFKTETANSLAVAIDHGIKRPANDDANVACLQGIVAAKLYFDEVLRVVVPMTEWWHDSRNQLELKAYLDPNKRPEKLRLIEAILDSAKKVLKPEMNLGGKHEPTERDRLGAFDRYVALAGLILWAGGDRSHKKGKSAPAPDSPPDEALKDLKAKTIADRLLAVFSSIPPSKNKNKLVWQISLNRTATAAVVRSVPAVKADAARTLFNVHCSEINWAVVDSGIDGTHPAFMNGTATECRIRQSFDFSNFRRIMSLSNAKAAIRKANLEALRQSRRVLPDDADDILKKLGQDARDGRPVDWQLVERLVTISRDEPPANDHGTHVAGIIGASREAQNAVVQRGAAPSSDDGADGMCPDIGLYDFRVLAPKLQDTEFAVIAALQYIRLLDARGEEEDFTIHLTYPIKEIDVERKKDWEKEQGKEKKRKEKNLAVKVRKDWSFADNGLTGFFDAHAKLAKKVQIVGEEKPHLIDLLEPM
jgi:serine protease AprX